MTPGVRVTPPPGGGSHPGEGVVHSPHEGWVIPCGGAGHTLWRGGSHPVEGRITPCRGVGCPPPPEEGWITLHQGADHPRGKLISPGGWTSPAESGSYPQRDDHPPPTPGGVGVMGGSPTQCGGHREWNLDLIEDKTTSGDASWTQS